MSKIYKNDHGTLISLQTGINVGEAGALGIRYQKPTGEYGMWVADASGTYVNYFVQNGDLDEAGLWKVQAYISGVCEWVGHGEVSVFYVSPPLL